MLTDAERSMLLEQLAREPRKLAETFTHGASLRTPSCGDEVTVRATLRGSEIQEFSGSGHGCMVSMAALAALCELSPRSVPEFSDLHARYTAAVNGDGELDGDLEPFAGIGRFPLRGQCATLAWRALAAALAVDVAPVPEV
jgi:nitrogen fixation protein NifU and related proteins